MALSILETGGPDARPAGETGARVDRASGVSACWGRSGRPVGLPAELNDEVALAAIEALGKINDDATRLKLLTDEKVDTKRLLIVADDLGWGDLGVQGETFIETPTLDALNAGDLYTELAAHGPAVGLPSDDDMGNSEVVHNALGAGRVFAQGAKLVNKAIETGAIFDSEVWADVVDHGRNGTLHLIGLHSDGGVHSSLEHLYALLRRAADEGVTSCAVHILHDGRDVDSRSALRYIDRTEAVLAEINAGGDGRTVLTQAVARDHVGHDATLVALDDQHRAGVDIVTDGEIRRESYSNRFASALDGVDLNKPGTAVDRTGKTVFTMCFHLARVDGELRWIR